MIADLNGQVCTEPVYHFQTPLPPISPVGVMRHGSLHLGHPPPGVAQSHGAQPATCEQQPPVINYAESM